jgi:hypothetical protein
MAVVTAGMTAIVPVIRAKLSEERHRATQQSSPIDGGNGSIRDIEQSPGDVRFTPESRRR